MKEYHPEENEIIEIRPGHYVKKQNDTVIGSANAGDIRAHQLKKNLPKVDVALIEAGLALAAISGFMVSYSSNSVVKFFAGVSFFFSCFAAYAFYYVYMLQHIPRAISDFYNTPYRRHNLIMLTWITYIWPIKTLFRSLFDPRLSSDSSFDVSLGYLVEFSYVTLLWSINIATITVIYFMIL